MKNTIQSAISGNIAVQQMLLADEALQMEIQAIVECLVGVFRRGGKVLFCGNGGSAADAQHLAAELSGRFYLNRKPLFAEALHVNSSFLTAVANDFGYDEVFARAVMAMGREGDVLFALSTSGNSPNIIKAIQAARAQKMKTVGMAGQTGGEMNLQCDYMLKIPSGITPRIQESHILLGHIICELTESAIFAPK